jgi:uncharacterized membrane protein required for colicin V production
MIAASVQDLTTDKLPLNWFDVLLVALLIGGFFRGRKNGMTREILPLFKWLAVVLICGFFHPVLAPFFANMFGVGTTASLIYGYLALAFGIIVVFLMFKKLLAPYTDEKSLFGSGEYYLGMMSGSVRFISILVVVLAVLHAPSYSEADIKAHDAYVKRWYGGGLYSGNYFPTVNTVQEQVLKGSFVGPYLAEYLAPILIETAPAGADKPKQKPPTVKIQK